MNGRSVSVVLVIVVILSSLSFVLTILPDNARAATLFVGGSGPSNYTHIQDAINASNPGDTIFVYSGTYYENITINKTLSLVGENRDTTIIDAGRLGDAVNVSADWVNFTEFTVKNSGWGNFDSAIEIFSVGDSYIADNIVSDHRGNGIFISDSRNNTISNNTLSWNEMGIYIQSSRNNTISDNIVEDSRYHGIIVSSSNGDVIVSNAVSSSRSRSAGISLSNALQTNITGNVMVDDGIIIWEWNSLLEHWNTHTIDTSNSVNGKPVYYWKDTIGGTIPLGAGQVILANCTNVIVENQVVNDGTIGIEIGHSSDITVSNITASSNKLAGMRIFASNNINVSNSVMDSSLRGLSISQSSNSTIINSTTHSNTYVGIGFWSSDNNTVINATSLSDNYGVDLTYSNNNTITDSTISLNQEGVRFYFSYNNIISYNTIDSSTSYGIILRESDRNILANNNASDNGNVGVQLRNSHNNVIRDNILSHNDFGSYLWTSNDTVLDNNTVINNFWSGLALIETDNITVARNTISLNTRDGLIITASTNIVVTDNKMFENGIFIAGDSVENWNTHVIDTSNTVNGKPVFYWKNMTGGTVPLGAGEVIVANCTGVVVENQVISNSSAGIEIGFSPGSIITNNTALSNFRGGIVQWYSDGNIIANNTLSGNGDGIDLRRSNFNIVSDNNASSNQWGGISLRDYNYNNTLANNIVSHNGWQSITIAMSDNNTLVNNTVANNEYGPYLFSAANNTIYHNSIINNTEQAFELRCVDNHWDNGYPSGGNYWSDYSGMDFFYGPAQNMPGSDGIGDTPYDVPDGNADRYPLMSPLDPLYAKPPMRVRASLSGTNFEDVTINWDLSLDDGTGFRNVLGYEIYRNTTFNRDGLGYGIIASISNGTSEFVDSLVGEGDSNNYFYKVCAVGPGIKTACAMNQAGKFTRPLSKGQNLVSIPLVQIDDAIESVLQTVRWNSAWSYDSLRNEWESNVRSKPYLGDLMRVDSTQGLWVDANEDSNLTVAGIVPYNTTVQLKSGWNLVGFPSFDDNYTVADLKAEVAVERMEGFDGSAPPYFLRVMTDGDFLQAGFGYWIRVKSESIWTVNAS